MRVDTKLARGLALAELRKLLRDKAPHDALPLSDPRHPVGAALRPLVWARATRRPADEAATGRVLDAIDSYFGGRPGSIVSRKKDGPEGRQRTYVHISASGTEYRPVAQIRLAHFEVSGTSVSLRDRILLEITGHALERFHLRTRAGLRRDILAEIAEASLSKLSLINIIAGTAGEAESRIAFTLADGLALSTLRREPSRPLDVWLTADADGIRDMHEEDVSNNIPYVATFIGPGEMWPNQVRFRDELLAFESKWAPYIDLLSRIMVSPEEACREMASIFRFRSREDLEKAKAELDLKLSQIFSEMHELYESDDAYSSMNRRREPEALSAPGF